jgi:serine phosphatase RsbU (regulator of sigma subunit)
VAGHQSPPLGTGTKGTVVQNEFPISPGDTVLLYTDGLIERRDEPLDVSLARLLSHVAAAKGLAPEDLLDAILAAREESGSTGDDIAMVAVQLRPRAAARAG